MKSTYSPMTQRQQYRTLIRLLPELYSAQTLETLPQHLLTLIPQLFRADTYSYNETNFALRRFKVLAHPSLEARGTLDAPEILSRLMHHHPMVVHNRTSDQRALKMSDLLSQRQFHRLELYDRVYRHPRTEYLMSGGFALSSAHDIVTIAIARASIDFSEDERDLLNLLRPHLRQAYANADAMTTYQGQIECRERSLEEAVDAAVIVIRGLSIKHASAMGRRWLLSFFRDDRAPNDALPERLRRWVRFSRAALDGKQSDFRPCTPLTVESGEGRLNIRLLKTSRDGDLVLLMRREVGRECPELLQRLGLPRRESAVLFWISKGKTSSEIAEILSIAPRTVEKHIERIHRKLGVETRTAAAAIAWATIRDS